MEPRRLADTPISDLLRGRITGRLNVGAAMVPLPEPLPALVLKAVKRARLSVGSRPMAARALSEDCHRRLEAGESVDEVAHSLRHVRQQAKALRRAHTSKARRVKRLLLTQVGGLIATILIIHAIVSIVYFSSSTTVSTNYSSVMSEHIRDLPPWDVAWPEYVLVQSTIPPDWNATDVDLRDPNEDDPDFLKARAYLTSIRPQIARLQDLTERPHFGFDTDGSGMALYDAAMSANMPDHRPMEQSANPILLDVMLPHLGAARSFARFFVWDAKLARVDGDVHRWYDNVRAAIRLADQVREHGLIIEELVSVAILALALEELTDALSDPFGNSLSEPQLAELQHLVEAYGHVRLDLRAETYIIDDFAQRFFTDNGKGNGHAAPDGMEFLSRSGNKEPAPRWQRPLEPALLLTGASRRQFMNAAQDFYTRGDLMMASPSWTGEADRFDWYLDEMDAKKHRAPIGMVYILGPAFRKAYFSQESANQSRDAALAMLATERFRRLHGRAPTSLSEVMPELLDTMPIDRFDGQPLRYMVRDGRPVIYSIGSDLDDDGGLAPYDWPKHKADGWLGQAASSAHLAPDGDWILYPALTEEGMPCW